MGLCGIARRHAGLERFTRSRWQIVRRPELRLFSWSGSGWDFRGVDAQSTCRWIVGTLDVSAELWDYAALLGDMQVPSAPHETGGRSCAVRSFVCSRGPAQGGVALALVCALLDFSKPLFFLGRAVLFVAAFFKAINQEGVKELNERAANSLNEMCS